MKYRIKEYLDGKQTPLQEQEMQKWFLDKADDLSVSEELEEEFNAMPLDFSGLEVNAYRKVASRLGFNSRRKTIIRWAASIAAAILLPLTGIFTYIGVSSLYSEPVFWTEVRVPFGEQKKIVLPDGTVLYLNSGSRVTYPSEFKKKESRVIFAEGEVYAEVTSDPKHPFIINSGDVGVRVLGTTFNLKSYSNSDCVELLLVEGSVEFSVKGDNSEIYKINPGECVQYNRSTGLASLSGFSKDDFKSFCDDRALHFFNLKLKDIVCDLERVFNRKIIITDAHLANTRFFAYFANQETLDQILSSLNANNKMKIKEIDGVIYIS